ncbi:hypothetical protein [Klebsiella aerogenes]|uniref:hypothetical protein n=1 Tax=Klebsiella aerogenes TaxID=548 RepID=UPI003D320695
MNINENLSKNAIIVASGPSAKGFEPPDGVTIIAVNGAIDWLSRADYFFTLDLSPDNRKRLKKRRAGVTYCVAGYLVSNALCFERVSLRHFSEPEKKNTPQWWEWRLQAVRTLSTDASKIHSGNSAWGALGLAYHLGITNAALIGVDASDEPRIDGGKSGNLMHLPMLFSSALPQINVVSLGKLNSIPQMSIEEWISKVNIN